MIVAVAALLVAASLSIGLRATGGWLDHWHPMDRLLLASLVGGVIVAALLLASGRFGLRQAGFGLAFSLAPVGLFDVTKWWCRSAGHRALWLIRTTAPPWIVALRWTAVIALLVAVVIVLARSTTAPPQ